jgi:putative endonuclease
MPYYVYILKSNSTGKSYIGHSKNLSNRVQEHNDGKSLSTRNGRPWNMVYHEEFQSRSEAMKREKYFKTVEGRKYLKLRSIL